MRFEASSILNIAKPDAVARLNRVISYVVQYGIQPEFKAALPTERARLANLIELTRAYIFCALAPGQHRQNYITQADLLIRYLRGGRAVSTNNFTMLQSHYHFACRKKQFSVGLCIYPGIDITANL